MKIKEIREMSDDDLKAKVVELNEQIFRAGFKKSLGEIDAYKQIRTSKKDLARVKTILRQRELQQQS